METALYALETTLAGMVKNNDPDAYTSGIVSGLEIAIDGIKRGMARDTLVAVAA